MTWVELIDKYWELTLGCVVGLLVFRSIVGLFITVRITGKPKETQLGGWR